MKTIQRTIGRIASDTRIGRNAARCRHSVAAAVATNTAATIISDVNVSRFAHARTQFRELLGRFRVDAAPIESLLDHAVARALSDFLRAFPIPFRDEHIHLTGSLDADFIWPRLAKLLDGPQRAMYESKIAEVYGSDALPIDSAADVDRLIRLGDDDR